MTGRAAPTAIGLSGVRGCRNRRQQETRRSSAMAASDTSAPARWGRRPGARQRPLPDAGIAFGGEVSRLSPMPAFAADENLNYLSDIRFASERVMLLSDCLISNVISRVPHGRDRTY